MELPDHYFSTQLCPYSDKLMQKKDHGKKKVTKFTDFGSQRGVNIFFDETSKTISFNPQYAQKGLQGLSNSGQNLPLMAAPQKVPWQQHDSVLGLTSYPEAVLVMKQLVRQAHNMKIQARRSVVKSSTNMSRRRVCQVLVNKILDRDPNSISSYRLNEKLQKSMSWSMHQFFKRQNKLEQALNEDCLRGYNSEFNGGLLSYASSPDQSKHVLYHAYGNTVYSSVAQSGDHRHIYQAETLSDLRLTDTIYQLSASPKNSHYVFARSRHKCHLLTTDESQALQKKTFLNLDRETISSITASPYLATEVLLSDRHGSVYLWDIDQGNRRLTSPPPDVPQSEGWRTCYFAGHPRQVALADHSRLSLLDHRSQFSSRQELFSLKPLLVKPGERLTAACSLGFPLHCLATDHSVFVIDQRFPGSSVLRWSHELVQASPQYLAVSPGTSVGRLIFVGAQQPSEVMAFPLSVNPRTAVTADVLPFRMTSIREFSEDPEVNSDIDLSVIHKRCVASLAGLAVAPALEGRGMAVYQLDSYGDLFHQVHLYRGSDMTSGLCEVSPREREMGMTRCKDWLTAVENGYEESSEILDVRAVSLDEDITKQIFSLSTIDQPDPPRDPHPPVAKPSQRLKPVSSLHCTGPNTRLHMALREGKDIRDVLKEREEDHIAKKKKLRRKMLTETQKGIKSREFILFDNFTEDDEDVPSSKGAEAKQEHILTGDQSLDDSSDSSCDDMWSVDLESLTSEVETCPDSPAVRTSGVRLAGLSKGASSLTYSQASFTGASPKYQHVSMVSRFKQVTLNSPRTPLKAPPTSGVPESPLTGSTTGHSVNPLSGPSRDYMLTPKSTSTPMKTNSDSESFIDTTLVDLHESPVSRHKLQNSSKREGSQLVSTSIKSTNASSTKSKVKTSVTTVRTLFEHSDSDSSDPDDQGMPFRVESFIRNRKRKKLVSD